MCVDVHSLSDDCLLLIFDLISLLDLLRLDKVCPRWASLLPSACARRRTLVLILGGKKLNDVRFDIPFNSTHDMSFDDGVLYHDLPALERDSSLAFVSSLPANKSFDGFLSDEDDGDESDDGFFDILYHSSLGGGGAEEEKFTEMARFKHALLTDRLVPYFTDLFPQVQTLVVVHPHCREKELRIVIDLVRSCWSLKTLKLWIHTQDLEHKYANYMEHHPVGTLLKSINLKSKSSLQKLTFDMYPREWDNQQEFTFPVEWYCFISRLKVVELYLGSYDEENFIWDIAHRFDHAQLRAIGMGNGFPFQSTSTTTYKDSCALNPTFSPKVRQFYHWNWGFKAVGQFSEFCWRFPSLTALEMSWTPNITFSKLVSSLASLAQLAQLSLTFNFREHPKSAFALVDDGLDGDRPKITSKLPQVKILKLHFYRKRSHLEFEFLSPLVFPSLEVLAVLDNEGRRAVGRGAVQCNPKCGPDFGQSTQCHRLLVLSLKTKFASQLVRLYAKRNYDPFVDWTSHVTIEQDDPLEIVGGDGNQPKEVEE